MLVKFNNSLTQAQYNALVTKDDGTLYFITDTQNLYKGEVLFSTLSGVDKVTWDSDDYIIQFFNSLNQAILSINFGYIFSLYQKLENKGSPNGYPPLDENGKIPTQYQYDTAEPIVNLTDFISSLTGMITGQKYYIATTKKIITATSATTGSSEDPNSSTVYIRQSNSTSWRWSGADMVQINAGLTLGETGSTAYYGDRGKIAYEHTFRTDNPHGISITQIGAAPSSHVGSYGASNHALASGGNAGFSTNDYSTSEKNKVAALQQVSGLIINNVVKATSATTIGDSGIAISVSALPTSGSNNLISTQKVIVDALSWG